VETYWIIINWAKCLIILSVCVCVYIFQSSLVIYVPIAGNYSAYSLLIKNSKWPNKVILDQTTKYFWCVHLYRYYDIPSFFWK